MKKILLIIAGFTWITQTTAQEKTAHQLKKELDAHPQQDTIRVNRLIELSLSTDYSLKEREKFSAEALSISRKIGYQYGEAYSLANMGYYQLRLGNKKEGESLLRQADSIAKKSGNPELIGFVLYRLGQNMYATGNKEGLDYLLKAEEALKSSGNYRRLFNCQIAIAGFYRSNLSNYPPALEYLLKATHSAEKAHSPSLLIDAWRSLGDLYSLVGDHANALIYLQKAGEENKKFGGNKVKYSLVQSSIGETYRLMGKYPEAIQAIKLAIEYDSSYSSYIDESNLADVYTHMDSLPLAFQYGFHSLAIAKQLEDDAAITWIHGILARAYLKKGMPDSSIYYARPGLDIAIKTGTIEYMRDNAAALADAYAYKKDFANAYRYHLQYINYKDSMLNAEVRNRTAVLQYNSDLDKKQAQITQLNQQKKAQQNFLISALILLMLIIITAGLLLRNNRQKQKANKLLQKQKQEIDDKAHELSVQKDNLEQSHNNVELLGEIGRKITSSLSVEKIISTVYDNVNTLMDASVFGIGIYNDDLKRIEFPATYENGEALPFYVNSIDDKNRFGPVCFASGKEIIIGDLDKEYKDHIQEVLTPHEGGQPLSVIFLPLTARGKKSGVITVQSFQQNAYTDYHLYMLRNIAIYTAIALENAESYEELSQTVKSLKSTQAQLIQSEKMASLGELTAGIAHEIQNPLNFVNNFSEVNKELLAEMKDEIDKGNIDEVKAIASDVIDNEEKINHHGKRADAIVKGMLQHSRSSSGQKEATDINTLADEYLRLAYHGLRAKDKSFNATLKTDYDGTIGNINIIPQDIGRVILNLINNAFYAVDEKKKQLSNGYEPTVSVSTKRINSKVEIKVSDNGNGIPQKVLDKIFQPFFTTKPTGQGTGLGLSLSYDIIKAHNGELKVETKEGEYAEFIIRLPVNMKMN